MTRSRPIRRALISTYDKTGLVAFARALTERGVTIISTGGSARALQKETIPVTDVSSLTGFPEIMGGRVKTLHPLIHGGLLGIPDEPAHAEAMKNHGIEGIDLLVCNLYPFEDTVTGGADFATCIENIDIGGPAMIRAAAKNHQYVTVVVDPSDYDRIIQNMDVGGGGTSSELRRTLAAKAYAHTAAYDTTIANWFRRHAEPDDIAMPAYQVFGGRLKQRLRYGENPHQEAGFYITGEPRPGVATATQHQGKELSYNNINDTDAAFELVAEFDPQEHAATAIIKHANPCGVATGATLLDAYRRALLCDPVSAFGGIIALNRTLDAETAEEIVKLFTEVIIAPHADDAAREIIAKKKNLRLLTTGGLPDPGAPGLNVRSVAGGYLVQSRDNARVQEMELKTVTKRAPGEAELADLLFAFTVCKHVKSNAIVYARDRATVGIGAGQMSRVDSARIAAIKAREAAEAAGLSERLTEGSVVASDAFFPFPDAMLTAAEAGATAVIQPGGSMRDEEVIAAADESGLAMVLTGRRHFRH